MKKKIKNRTKKEKQKKRKQTNNGGSVMWEEMVELAWILYNLQRWEDSIKFFSDNEVYPVERWIADFEETVVLYS